MFTGEITPREVLVLIDRLPSDSALAEASAQDDELAEMMVEEGVAPPSGGPRVRDFGPTNQLLTGVLDRLGELVAVTITANGGTAKPQPLPRPETAADRLARRVADASHDYILDQIEAARAASVE